MNNITTFPTPIKTLDDYWMVMNYEGVEVVAQGSTQEECRTRFERELACISSLLDNPIDIAVGY